MRTLPSWLGLLGTLALAGLPAPAGAQPVGSEFQINTYTTGRQKILRGDALAGDANGNFVAVWSSSGQGGTFAQRYDSSGGRVGGEFRAGSGTVPSVASDVNGNFVVVWQGIGPQDADLGIFGQRFDSSGGALGGEFRVNSFTTGRQTDPSVASDANGNFVVVWESEDQDGFGEGIFGQRYDSAGNAIGLEFQVNSSTTEYQRLPSVASDAVGNFVVVWNTHSFRGLIDDDVFGQRYDSGGLPQGAEFRVNSYTRHDQYLASVASDAHGNFVVVWQGDNRDRRDFGIFGQRYDSRGAPQGTEFQVNSYTTTNQSWSKVVFDASGNFLVVWDSFHHIQDFSGGTFGRLYDSAGVGLGDCDFQINTYTTAGQRFPSVAATGTNQFVVAWESYNQDGHVEGVFGQRLDFGSGIIVLKPNCGERWLIGALQTIEWTHDLGANATFRIELDRNDDGTYEELIAADAPATSATRGSFAWTVTGPRSGRARVRVAWTDDLAVSDASDATFQIRPVGLD